MIDAYADGLLSKQEFEPRIKKGKQRLMKLEREQKNQADEEMQRNNLKVIVGCMQEFSEKIEKGIKGLDWEAKRKIICAIVKQIEIDDDEVQIIYKLSPNNLPQNQKKESLLYCSRYNRHRRETAWPPE